MKFGAMVLAVCGVMHGYQAASAKGSIEGQVMNLKAGAPLKKANVQLVMMNQGGAGGILASESVKRAPPSGRFAASACPPCATAMRRTSARPSPSEP